MQIEFLVITCFAVSVLVLFIASHIRNGIVTVLPLLVVVNAVLVITRVAVTDAQTDIATKISSDVAKMSSIETISRFLDKQSTETIHIDYEVSGTTESQVAVLIDSKINIAESPIYSQKRYKVYSR